MQSVSLILPAYNEDPQTVGRVVAKARTLPLFQSPDAEVLVVDDGSSPPLPPIPGARVVRHPCNLGNGASIKTGAREARGKVLVFMDADGQHNPEAIPGLIAKLNEGFDMVVGARVGNGHASAGRWAANTLYNKLASFMTGRQIDDLTSGFRVVRANKFRRFLYLLPNGFSYPTTSTMAFFRSGYPVAYVPIPVEQRNGKSKIKLLKDGMRFFIIILKIGALFSPMRLFLPASAALFVTGICYYAYTYIYFHRFTNMSALLFIASMLTFLIGIVSEQISALHFQASSRDEDLHSS